MNKTIAGIHELRIRLGHYLRLVRSGETVTITNRGVPVGRIVPIHADIAQRMVALCEAGEI